MGMKKPDLIEIPDSVAGGYKKRSQWGTILSWGSKCTYSFRVGQKVYFKWQDHRAGVSTDDGDVKFVREQELLAEDEDVGS